MPSDTQYAIRQVSEITGVNSVTLRAWQRRYGLIKPARTERGHRVYSAADIERIRQILHWLDQGVSIGKVRGLIDQTEVMEIDPEWQVIIERLLESSQNLKFGKLETDIRELSRQYPTDLFLKHIIRPWLSQLNQSSRVDKNLIEQGSKQVLMELLMQFIKSRSGPLCAVLRCGQAHPLESVLARYELLHLKCRSLDLGTLQPDQLNLAVQRLKAQAYIVIPGAGLSSSWFDRHRNHWPERTFFTGSIGRIYVQSGWLTLPYDESLTQMVTRHDAFSDLV